MTLKRLDGGSKTVAPENFESDLKLNRKALILLTRSGP